MDKAVLEPVLKKHNLVAFFINMGWVLIRRREYIDVYIQNEPYNSVQILFHIATKVKNFHEEKYSVNIIFSISEDHHSGVG